MILHNNEYMYFTLEYHVSVRILVILDKLLTIATKKNWIQELEANYEGLWWAFVKFKKQKPIYIYIYKHHILIISSLRICMYLHKYTVFSRCNCCVMKHICRHWRKNAKYKNLIGPFQCYVFTRENTGRIYVLPWRHPRPLEFRQILAARLSPYFSPR